MKNDKTLSGSIVLVKGEHFISKQVIMHMTIYAKLTGRKPLKYSHSEFLLWDADLKQLYTIGARNKGTEISKVQDYYGKTDILILKPVIPLTEEENAKLWEFHHKIDPSRYQFSNFISWINYLKTGIYLSTKGSKRNYCYELSARFANVTGRWQGNLDKVSIYDLYENFNFKPI